MSSSRTRLILSVLETCFVSMQKESSTDEAAKGKKDSLHKGQADEGTL